MLGAIGLGFIPSIPDPLGVGPGCVLLDLTAQSINCGQNILDQQHARGIRRVELSADPTDALDTRGLIDHFSFKLGDDTTLRNIARSEEHTSELQSLMRHSYAVFCLKKKQ